MYKGKSHKDLRVAGQFLLQGLLVGICSIPLYYLFKNPNIFTGGAGSLLNIAGLGLSAYGLYGEFNSDKQLQNFKDNKPANYQSGQLCRDGYWLNSRHPNLFFELLFWSGLCMIGRQMTNLGYRTSADVYTIAGPIALWGIMTFLTIPITEKTMAKKRSKADYLKYVSETNMYWPYPAGPSPV